MTGLIDWCAARARMVVALILVSVGAGLVSYWSLPKEGAPDIDIPVIYVSVALPGVSAPDSERLLVKPLEQELRGLEGLKEIQSIATIGHAGIVLEFDFDWDQAATLAEVRDKVSRAEAEFPAEAEEPTITEINLSEFPVLVVSLSGEVPERTLLRLANDLQREIESLGPVLEAALTGHRDEMVEVLVDPLKLESYDITGEDLLRIVERNNQLVAADRVESDTASFSVTVPGSLDTAQAIYELPLKVSDDRIVRLADMAEIRRTFEDAESRARFNGEKTIALQVSKRIGENIIETVALVRERVDAVSATWPEPLQRAVSVEFSMDQSREVVDMVGQLESSVLTAIILVMIVVLAALGLRSAVLVGIAIPCSFLLSFGLMAALGMSVNNMTMFGMILAVGMLVDGAIVVVEYADKEIARGTGPMRAYAAAAKRMFWPIVASTATTLCAFLPMLFWPGMPGEFMGQLPVTLIFVLSASLIVALIFLPILGGIAGRIARATARLFPERPAPPPIPSDRRSLFGRAIGLIVMNPVGPLVALVLAVGAVAGTFAYYGEHQKGVEFFVETDPERAIIRVRARGNLSLAETDRLVAQVEAAALATPGVASVFAFAGDGGLNSQSGEGPNDMVGQVQIELEPWRERGSGADILAEVERRIGAVPGAIAEIAEQAEGPQQGKPIQLELASNDWPALLEAAAIARARFDATEGLQDIDDTRPLPGIEWQIAVDRVAAGRYGADIATIAPLVQLVTRGVTLDTLRPPDSDEEIDIRARFPEAARTLTTLEELRVSTERGLVPMGNFTTRTARPKLEEIVRTDGERSILVRADVDPGTSDIAVIEEMERWLAEEAPLPATVKARFVGDREEQAESQAFLMQAFAGALGLMFVILLAQFNSVYNAVLVLSAVVMSVAGVLIGMLVMDQKFSIIMTGTGIVALAGIVVNNNIVLIDTFQDHARRMDPLEAIVRTAEDRIRPVLLTTVTTMAGLTPMMFATSLDFATGTVAVGAPTALWWVQLATAVVFGLGTATVLTLVVTPAALAAREWLTRGSYRGAIWVSEILRRAVSRRAAERPFWQDRRLARGLRGAPPPEILWEESAPAGPRPLIRAAE